MTDAITDFGQFSELRRGANNQDPAAIRQVAGQFEALFVQTMMKNMRASSLGEPLFGNSGQHEMYQEMLDKQLAVEMSGGRGLGLKDILMRQLGGDENRSDRAEVRPVNQIISITKDPGRSRPEATIDKLEVSPMKQVTSIMKRPVWSRPEDFVRDIWPHARDAAAKLKVSAEALLAQAALETGWGKHVMRKSDGASSLNLFGIKANSSWEGPTAVKPTLEFRDGVANKEFARFRAYPDVAASFADYVNLIGSQPRYDAVRDLGSDPDEFADALQKSGYATDPDYAQKIRAILDGSVLRNALQKLKPSGLQSIPVVRAGRFLN